MELVNTTPVPAHVVVSELESEPTRWGMLVAKATFHIDHNRAELDTQRPLPIFVNDVETELGVIPSDHVPRKDDAFEVWLLGAAYAPPGERIRRMTVRLSVGEVTRELLVSGDRVWLGNQPSDPEPFERMPLGWDRAFGGACLIELDDGAFLEVTDRWNRHGRGFDAQALAEQYREAFHCPPGYPVCHYTRQLPNVEDPSCPVRTPEDAPAPMSWAPIPIDCAFAQKWMVELTAAGQEPEPAEVVRRMFHRAHPAWVIETPPAKARIEARGVTPDQTLSFELPRVRVLADYVVGRRRGTRELVPQAMLLLPDERRMTLVFRSFFRVDYEPAYERCFRLRLDEGWNGRQAT